jgi:hypothetical protein
MTYLGICRTCVRIEECGMDGAVSECERFEAGKPMEVCRECSHDKDKCTCKKGA